MTRSPRSTRCSTSAAARAWRRWRPTTAWRPRSTSSSTRRGGAPNPRGPAPGGAVANADLSFSTRELAERAPAILEDQAAIDAATGVVSVSQRLSLEEARAKLSQAAAQAGLDEAQLARAVLELHGGGRREPGHPPR